MSFTLAYIRKAPIPLQHAENTLITTTYQSLAKEATYLV